MTSHSFGGNWTTNKLVCLSKYLSAYTKALKYKKFNLIYIDAFAGTGWVKLKNAETEIDTDANDLQTTLSLFDNDIFQTESHQFRDLDGSARIALQTEPHFNKYIFIEKDASRFAALQLLQNEFPNKDISFFRQDANEYLTNLCANWKSRSRAVLFLDPYGMQVSWNTIERIAETGSIDLWYLFPLGMALNRLLRKNGNINETSKRKIDQILGTTEWYDLFYESVQTTTLFGIETNTQKRADFDFMSNYIIKRLESIFPGVAPNPKMLKNSTNNPLFLLCFASANQKGSSIAVNIAKNILSK